RAVQASADAVRKSLSAGDCVVPPPWGTRGKLGSNAAATRGETWASPPGKDFCLARPICARPKRPAHRPAAVPSHALSREGPKGHKHAVHDLYRRDSPLPYLSNDRSGWHARRRHRLHREPESMDYGEYRKV